MGTSANSRSPESPYYDNAVLNELCGLVADRLDGLLDHLEIDLRHEGKRYVGSCPVHGGDNPEAFNLYPDGDDARGVWYCYSHECHRDFTRSLVGLARGVLSHDRHEWTKPGDRKVPHKEAVDHLLSFLGIRIGDVHYDPSLVSDSRFAREVECLIRNPPTGKPICDREAFRRRVAIPSDYFIGRGFGEAVLDRYDVGLCVNARSPLRGRVLVPVHDEQGMILGCLARAPSEKCDRCHSYHGDAPCPDGDRRSPKWVCSDGFVDKYHLYNLWRAKPYIYRSNCVVLVEGAPDVWRLEEAGIHNAVALMGAEVTDIQRSRLECLAVTSIVVAVDMDEAGRRAADVIWQRCGYIANIFRLELPEGKKDVAEMSVDEVKQHILPFVLSKSKNE